MFLSRLQEYLADTKQAPLLGQPFDPRHRPTVGSLEGGGSYKRDTSVRLSLR